uniref:Uncharacterized protein n=1 Tax=Plectus sambesii TaxID=2011161 RepID=A0A914XE16_9BILA
MMRCSPLLEDVALHVVSSHTELLIVRVVAVFLRVVVQLTHMVDDQGAHTGGRYLALRNYRSQPAAGVCGVDVDEERGEWIVAVDGAPLNDVRRQKATTTDWLGRIIVRMRSGVPLFRCSPGVFVGLLERRSLQSLKRRLLRIHKGSAEALISDGVYAPGRRVIAHGGTTEVQELHLSVREWAPKSAKNAMDPQRPVKTDRSRRQ